MAKNNFYFYFSGLIALSLFALFMFMSLYMAFMAEKQDIYALNKDNYISISLEIPKIKSNQRKNDKKATAASPVVKKVAPVEENVDVNDLFSDVWTKKIIKDAPKQINKRRMAAIEKKIETTKENVVDDAIASNDQNSSLNENQNSVSTANEVNEYLAKIQALVYESFHVPFNSQGHSVKTVIELNSLGKLIDFRVLTYSDNDDLNEEADKMKDRLLGVIFPLSPENISTRTVVILTSKE